MTHYYKNNLNLPIWEKWLYSILCNYLCSHDVIGHPDSWDFRWLSRGQVYTDLNRLVRRSGSVHGRIITFTWYEGSVRVRDSRSSSSTVPNAPWSTCPGQAVIRWIWWVEQLLAVLVRLSLSTELPQFMLHSLTVPLCKIRLNSINFSLIRNESMTHHFEWFILGTWQVVGVNPMRNCSSNESGASK